MGERVRLYRNDCVVAVPTDSRRPRDLLVALTYADPLTRIALAMRAEEIYWVRRLVALLTLGGDGG